MVVGEGISKLGRIFNMGQDSRYRKVNLSTLVALFEFLLKKFQERLVKLVPLFWTYIDYKIILEPFYF